MTQPQTTFEQEMDRYRNEQKALAKKYRYFYELLRGAFVVAVFVVIGVFLFTDELLAEYVANVYVTVVGAIATIVILDRRNEERLTRQRKQELFLQLGSHSNDFALEAKRLLELEGWLEEALAQKKFPGAGWQGMKLGGANLASANLLETNLTAADLVMATLTDASLGGANLSDAVMWVANLTNAHLFGANLMNAHLEGAKLANANLFGANLKNARLNFADLTSTLFGGANLTDADFRGANPPITRVNEHTILPNGARWTPDTDLARFTDPDHPQFWRSENPFSPAYKGRKA